MKIAVIGTGYVGLVTGTCFAETGNTVICVDIDKEKVSKLSKGEMTIYEPGLEKLLRRNLREGRLQFTTDLGDSVNDSLLILLALPTPPGADGSADLSAILKVANDLGKIIKEYKVIIDKSTVPVGTAEKVRKAIVANCKSDFDVVSNPEFLREGLAVEDFMKPDRVIIGTSSERAKKILTDLYAPFVRQGNPLVFMDERSAELTKYAANSFLATKISFMNEIAILCERLGADVDMVRRGLGSDDRIGKRFLFPGIGYGGSCFPKDVKALVQSANEVEYNFNILKAVMHVNEKQKIYLLPRIKKHFNNDLKNKKITLWGLAFKPNTDDIREAPALAIIEELLKEGASVTAFDPEAMANVKKILGDKIIFADSQYDAIKDCDALIVATEWNEFRTPDFDRMVSLMKNKVIFDGRNVYEPGMMRDLGFHYESIGRGTFKS
jgi:UDPglucose 6-dehydrogenase